MYKLYITGAGAEVTQGCLPIDLVNQIYEEVDNESNLPTYFFNAQWEPDKVSWTDIDDNFHAYGALTDNSILRVENVLGDLIYEKTCDTLDNHIDYTTELYPEDFELEPIGVLTCIEKFKGDFFQGYINTDEFNPLKLRLHIKKLGEISIIDSVSYEGVELQDVDNGDSISKDFIVYLEE